MAKLTGRVALITGASSGMGAAQAHLFADEGASVVLADVNPAGERVASEIGPNAFFRTHDVGSEDDWVETIAETERRFGKLDILVNSAGISVITPIANTTLAMYMDQFRVNQLGTFLGMRAALNPMIRVGGGAIVNISSGAGLKGAPGMCGYAATKWAVRGMTKSAAGEFAIHKIRVNAIFPGPIDTPMLAKNTKAFNDALVAATPLGRMGSVDEIARATLFLASDDSSFITGADVAVDGGGTI